MAMKAQRVHQSQMSLAVVLLTLSVVCLGATQVNHPSASNLSVWQPDNGDGTYKNPIIYADYSDPDAVRVGDDFYLVSSSFNCSPGLPILHSKDLVNWKIIGHALAEQPPFDVFSKPQHGNGVWAPAIRFHKGEFYVYYPDPDYGIYLVKAKDPAGPWSKPLLVRSAKGWIDPCPFWDDDGNAYLVHAWANSRSGIKSVLTINRMSSDGTRILDEGTTVFDGHANHPTIEGPKLYKRNGYYYIFAPAGGVSTGWQTVLRSRNIYGPYKDRVVMDQGKTNVNGPHQGALIELQSGESWFIHFQDRGPYGRIIHLQPARWMNDWPVIGSDADGDGKGEPVLSYKKPDVGGRFPSVVPQTNDEFELELMYDKLPACRAGARNQNRCRSVPAGRASSRLAACCTAANQPGLQWQWQANPQAEWMSLTAHKGWLRLYAVPLPDQGANLWLVPNLLLEKLPGPEFTLTTKLQFDKLASGEKAGVIVMGMDYAYLAVEKRASDRRLILATAKDANEGGKEIEAARATSSAGESLFFRVTVSKGVCRFSYSSEGTNFIAIGEPFQARAGRWIGAKIGLFCLAKSRIAKPGFVDFDWFRFEKEAESLSLVSHEEN